MRCAFTKLKKIRPSIVENRPLSPRSKSIESKSIGVLGGGQLSLMLAQAAKNLGIRFIPYCSSDREPAAKFCSEYVVGQLDDAARLSEFFERVDWVTFENDFLPYEVLKSFQGVNWKPGLASIERIRDKIEQKRICASLGIRAPEYEIFSGGHSATWIQKMIGRFDGEFVLKWARGGYDGKGVYLFNGDSEAAENFCAEAESRGVRVFAEQMIKFKRELSLVSCRAENTEIRFYPLVVSVQAGGICVNAYGPAVKCGVDAKLEAEAREAAQKLGNELSLVGVYAIEFFEDHSGILWANEFAPRVHNTGHFTMNASKTSQFENHCRAVLGLALGSVETEPAFAMRNLIGEEKPRVSILPPFYLHWYEKDEVRPGRKMGHINWVGPNVQDIPLALEQMQKLK